MMTTGPRSLSGGGVQSPSTRRVSTGCSDCLTTAKVNYEVNQEAIDFIIAEYGLEGGTTDITSWCKIINDMNGASDDKFLRAWLIVAIGTFLCPTTSLSASPKCYPAVMHLANVPMSNWCRFVVE